MLYVQWHVYLHQLGEEFMCNQTHDYHVIVISKQCVTFEHQLKDQLHEHHLIYNLVQSLGLPSNLLLFPFFFTLLYKFYNNFDDNHFMKACYLTKMYNSPPFSNNHGLQISCLIMESFPLTPIWFLIPSQCSWTTLQSNYSTYFHLNTTNVFFCFLGHHMCKVHQHHA